MDTRIIKKDELCEWIRKSLDKLYQLDGGLIYKDLGENDVYKHNSERAIVHRFAIYLEELKEEYGCKSYDIDCEYSRNNDAIKRNSKGTIVVPDVIIHKRGHRDNLVVFECKGWWPHGEKIKKDTVKAQEYVDNPNLMYKYGVVIKFGKTKESCEVCIYNRISESSYQ